ncbi:hypothetical protein VP01_292g1 [Puccinia sorghi]|uniref:Uncharacterized protein n=1 Tax=Puccinia sorghi TaxID=27349 RepID=A0A0L6V1Y6_9BASI|nr:hypothetical protein VP01_292g1 [Puccinia sorghi]
MTQDADTQTIQVCRRTCGGSDTGEVRDSAGRMLLHHRQPCQAYPSKLFHFPRTSPLLACFPPSPSSSNPLYLSTYINTYIQSQAENQVRRKLSSYHPWDSLTVAHLRVIHAYHADESSRDPLAIFDAQKSLIPNRCCLFYVENSAYNDWFRSDNTAWSLPVLYVIYRDLRAFATRV